MCRRFIPIDCDEVARIAAEIERDLAAHADELASLDPIEAYEDFLFFPESAQPDRAEQRAKREEAPVQLSLFDGESDEPARGFYESHATETVPSERTGRPVKRQYAFAAPDGAPLLLAGVHDRGRFSLVTTEPNAAVAPVHNRMPLALEPGEAALWLRGVYEPLLDRGAVRLTARPER